MKYIKYICKNKHKENVMKVSTAEQIEDLELDISYTKDCLKRGFYKSTIGKHKLGAELERLEKKLKTLKL